MPPLIDLTKDIAVDLKGAAAGAFTQKLARGGTSPVTSRGILEALPAVLKELLRKPHKQIEDRVHDLHAAKMEHDKRTIDAINCLGTIADAMSGDMALVLGGDAAVNIAAADLNAAPVGKFKRIVSARLENAKGEAHRWARFAPLVTPTEAVADVDVTIPTYDSATTFKDGVLSLLVTFITGAGKTYAAADSVAVKIQVNAADSLLGYSLTTDGVTKTFNVV